MRRVQTHVGSLSEMDDGNGSNRKQRYKAFVYARMSSKNPYLGTFHHAPPAGNVGAKYFHMQITSEEELQKQKAHRHNPHTGTFRHHRQRHLKSHLSKSKLKNRQNSSATNKPTKLKRVSTKAAQAVQIQKQIQSKLLQNGNDGKNIDILDTWKTWKPRSSDGGQDNNHPTALKSMLKMKMSNNDVNNSNDNSYIDRITTGHSANSTLRRKTNSLTNFDYDKGKKETSDNMARQKSNSDTSNLIRCAARATARRSYVNTRESKINDDCSNGIRAVEEEEKKTPSSMKSNTRSHSSPHLMETSIKDNYGILLDLSDDNKSFASSSNRKNLSVNLPVGRDKFCANNKNNAEDNRNIETIHTVSPHVSPVLRYLEANNTLANMPPIDDLMEGTPKNPSPKNSNGTTNKKSESSTLFSRRKATAPNADRKLSPTIQTLKSVEKKNTQVTSPKAETFDQLKPWFIHHSQIQDIYELEQYAAGYGTYSQVYRGKHKTLGGQFAIKTINKRYLVSEEEKQSVRREIEVQLRFHHPNIVRLYEVYEEAEKLHLVMEHATEGTLAESMPRKVSERRASKIIYQLLVAVSHLHENGILHSDIKPDNVLLNKAPPLSLPSTSKHTLGPELTAFNANIDHLDIFNDDGRVQLCDFGLSRKVPDIKYFRHTGDVHKVPFTGICGSPGYFAPELLRKEAYGKQTDLWSVGIIMYELIFGFSPFRPYHKCLDQPLEFSERYPVSEEAKALLIQLLVVKPSKRINAKKALQSPWFIKYGCL
jgi:hypothetical protein